MTLKKLTLFLMLSLACYGYAQQNATTFKLYGFIRNDFYYNSRQNQEAIDGLFHIFPKPVDLSKGIDKNDVPQAEMLSIATRIGIDITGNDILGAKSSAKIETDLAGFSTSYYVLRIRQAYAKLDWKKTELLMGQTWHPLFGSVMPTGMSLNAGSPFQPFNRSPQVRLKYKISNVLSITGAAIYQMQYLSQGPSGSSALYLKNAIIPNLFLGTELKTKKWTSGAGIDFKTIQPQTEKISSVSAVVYTQYIRPKFQFKAKALWGQNLSDHLMIGGYGVSKLNSDSTVAGYTNFNTGSIWVNAVYGNKIQIGIFGGWSQNFGTTDQLVSIRNKYTSYGYGNFDTSAGQTLVDRLVRVAPHISYNLPNVKFGIEYDLTSAKYGKLNAKGRVDNPYNIDNHRIIASMSYLF